MTSTPFSPLSIEIWTSRAKEHAALMSPYTDAFVHRRKIGQKDPVQDFLFTYYNCSPLKLKQWIPSLNEELIINSHVRKKHPWLNDYWFCESNNILSLKKNHIKKNIFALAVFIGRLCFNILQRPPRFSCFGLHEWAMIYKQSKETIRHQNHPLRLSCNEIDHLVESQAICCSHYDAYRFFTKEARPLNVLNPLFETRLEMEQGGCLHANMDLYKWASKLWPWIGSDFIAQTFLLSLKCRELDMRSSPYDLSQLGYEPICIETEEGRKHYQKEQQFYAEQAYSLRKQLLAFCENLKLHTHLTQKGQNECAEDFQESILG